MKKLWCWCQKVLPLVYDESLSYYEVLCKVTKKLNDVIDTVNSFIGKTTNEIIGYVKTLFDEYITENVIVGDYQHITDGLRLYIDGVNGDDITGDGTVNKPFKTIERWASIANNTKNGKNDIRCYIMTACVYELHNQSFNSISLHITGQVPDVVLKFTNKRDIKFYGGHYNFNNVTIQYDGGSAFAFEGTSTVITNCTLDFILKVFGGYVSMTNTSYLGIDAEGAYITINGCSVINTSPTVSPNIFNDCVVRMLGSAQNVNLTASGEDNYFIIARESYLAFFITIRTQDNKYAHGMYARGSVISTIDTNFNNLKTRTLNGIEYVYTNLIISESGARVNPE